MGCQQSNLGWPCTRQALYPSAVSLWPCLIFIFIIEFTSSLAWSRAGEARVLLGARDWGEHQDILGDIQGIQWVLSHLAYTRQMLYHLTYFLALDAESVLGGRQRSWVSSRVLRTIPDLTQGSICSADMKQGCGHCSCVQGKCPTSSIIFPAQDTDCYWMILFFFILQSGCVILFLMSAFCNFIGENIILLNQ